MTTEFTFSEDSTPLACFSETDARNAGAETFTEQLRKWGFSLAETASATPASMAALTPPNAVLARFHYASPTSASSALHFHDGLARDFLRCFFATPCVLQRIPWGRTEDDDHHTARGSADAVQFTPLTCEWTSLQPLEEALVEGRVARRLRDAPSPGGASSEVSHSTDSPRLPLVKRPERYLSNGLCVADELRALCLLPLNADTEADEDDDDDDDAYDWSGASSCGLTRRALRTVLSRDKQRELIFQFVRALAIGGSTMNQYEDHLDPYLDAARALYRTCVTSLDVQRVSKTAASREPTESGVAALDEQNDSRTDAPKAADAYLFVPKVLSRAFDITQLRGQRVAPASDVAAAATGFCQVIVNPQEQTVVLWCHRSSTM